MEGMILEPYDNRVAEKVTLEREGGMVGIWPEVVCVRGAK